MTIREQGFLLLTGYLGDPQRKVLTIPQLRKLALLARNMPRPQQEREMTEQDLIAMGCSREIANRVIGLLSQEDQLIHYLHMGNRADCIPITRISDTYPDRLRKALQLDAPGALWIKGDPSLLQTRTVSVVGSRDLRKENLVFAKELGKQAALQGYTLVSGNARGADRAAQDSCLAHGGSVICVVADALDKQPLRKRVLYVSEEGFDLPFSATRALQRNRIIHSLSEKTFVVQCAMGKGGTWSGTTHNLRHNWSQVICFDDGSPVCRELECRGAVLAGIAELEDFGKILPRTISLMQTV